ncbi:MAG: helix-turn-helix domain protein [Neobacillus sp.]|jgi:transcriptional regulator with XRE-family HTH domain|nr:helix-turn-helix domain protein [Neobacillus sp.]
MNSVEKVKALCKERKIPISKLEKELEFANGYIGQLKKGSLPNDRLIKIAEYLKVPSEYLLGKEGVITCRECGLMYYSSDIDDVRKHEEHHKKYIEAARFYGYFYPHPMIETEKNKNLRIATDYDKGFEQRISAWIEVIRAYFSRSLSGWEYELDHPLFDEYAAMLLNTKAFEIRINDSAVFTRLVGMYGKQDGLIDGETYYHPLKSKKNHTIAAHKDGYENWTPDELEKIEEYKQLLLAARNNKK